MGNRVTAAGETGPLDGDLRTWCQTFRRPIASIAPPGREGDRERRVISPDGRRRGLARVLDVMSKRSDAIPSIEMPASRIIAARPSHIAVTVGYGRVPRSGRNKVAQAVARQARRSAALLHRKQKRGNPRRVPTSAENLQRFGDEK
jgi:hypothetical protein